MKSAQISTSVQRDLLSVRETSGDRAGLERHVHPIGPADPPARQPRPRGTVALFGRRRAQREIETRELARQELTLRTEALTQQLASCGLTCRRLHNDELARLFYRCLTPERALAHPFPAQLLAAVGRPPRGFRRQSNPTHQKPMHFTGSEHHWGVSLRSFGIAQRLLPP